MLRRTGLARFDSATEALIDIDPNQGQRSHNGHRDWHHSGQIRLRLGQCGGQKEDSNPCVLYARLNGDSECIGRALIQQLGRQPGKGIAQSRQCHASNCNLQGRRECIR